MIFRTAEQKSDLKGSFNRPDRPFFAAGACHILAQAFLDVVATDDWVASLIAPREGFRGTHVYVSNGIYTFDYHGFTASDRYQEHCFTKMNRLFPGWMADVLELHVSPVSEEFCSQYNLRMPEQFYADPRPRAIAFVRRFVEMQD